MIRLEFLPFDWSVVLSSREIAMIEGFNYLKMEQELGKRIY
jgi:hypothetical protein